MIETLPKLLAVLWENTRFSDFSLLEGVLMNTWDDPSDLVERFGSVSSDPRHLLIMSRTGQ